jgi:hypothetical protein
MANLIQDRVFVEAGIAVLGDYLLSKELFYPLEGDLPRLTLGNLLLAQKRLEAVGAHTGQAQVEAVRSQWQVAWEQKCSREIHTRLELWANFLSDYRHSPESNADRYSVEVRHRAILALLSKEAESVSAEDTLLEMDSLLKVSFAPGNFIWEKQVEPVFDRRDYWFLFGKLKSK